MLNSFIVDISKTGITGSGGIFGTFAPQIGDTSTFLGTNGNQPDLSVRVITVGQTVSALTNPDFLSPIVFGSDKVLIWVNKRLYYPDVDYKVKGNKITWLNTNISINPEDEVVLWGPTNKFTADLVTFEHFNIKDSSVYNTSTLYIKAGEADNQFYPFNQSSTFLFVDGNCLIPNDHYTYNANEFTLNLTAPLNVLSDKVFGFYFNLKPSGTYRLGEALVRLLKTDGVVNVALTEPALTELQEESHVFLNGGRAVYDKNYKMGFPLLKWDNTAGFTYSTSNKLDIAYFSDIQVGLGLFSNSYIFQTNTQLINVAVTGKLGFHFINGVLSTPPVTGNQGSVALKDYNIIGQVLSWIGTPPVTTGYAVRFEGFTDLYSKQYVETVYSQNSTIPTPLPDIADITKVVAWKEGIANFSQLGDFTINTGTIPKTLTFTNQSVNDKVVVMYFKQTSYSSLWKVETYNGAITVNQTLNLNSSAKAVNTTWVFVNGVKLYPGVHFVLENQNQRIKFLNAYGTSKVVIFYV